jgi:hypothetical protein
MQCPQPREWTAKAYITLFITSLVVLNALQAAEFELRDQVLTVRTARYVATFENGCLSSLTNRLTDEVYASRQPELAQRLRHMAHGLGHWRGETDDPRVEELRQKFHFWQGGYGEIGGKPIENLGGVPFVHHPTEESKVSLERIGDQAARVTWRGLRGFGPGGSEHPDENYSLRLEVERGSGDLLIDATARSKTPGVYAVGFGMTGFSRDLNFIMPLFQGCAFRPASQPPFRMVSRWPSPFNSSLVVAEGRRGSVAMWMADPELGDRHFHFHNTEDAFDVMFYSINQMPFERHREAPSRPIRLNVYEGNWVRAARPYRDWWEKAFEVKRLEEKKPDWIDEIGWRSGFGREMPPPEIGPQCIYFAPQAWKVQPEIGDGGLFPYEMEPGPQLSGRFEPILPRVRETGARVMVYYNINHMNEGHPLAPRFWEHRINRGFGTPRKQREPEPESRRSFLVNTAYRPWQDLLLKWIKLTHRRFDISGFYMDCASGHPNGGRIDGRNDPHDQLELMKRIKRQIPGAFLGVEYLGEATGQVTDQASWGFDGWFGGNRREGGESLFRGCLWRAKHAHPIVGFLYNPYLKIHIFGNGLATPTFHEVMGRVAGGEGDPGLGGLRRKRRHRPQPAGRVLLSVRPSPRRLAPDRVAGGRAPRCRAAVQNGDPGSQTGHGRWRKETGRGDAGDPIRDRDRLHRRGAGQGAAAENDARWEKQLPAELHRPGIPGFRRHGRTAPDPGRIRPRHRILRPSRQTVRHHLPPRPATGDRPAPPPAQFHQREAAEALAGPPEAGIRRLRDHPATGPRGQQTPVPLQEHHLTLGEQRLRAESAGQRPAGDERRTQRRHSPRRPRRRPDGIRGPNGASDRQNPQPDDVFPRITAGTEDCGRVAFFRLCRKLCPRTLSTSS